MSKEVKGIEEAVEVLATMNVAWATVNRIQNSMWVTGVAFFDKSHRRIAYYDEAHNVLSINQKLSGEPMKSEVIKQLGIYLVSESQHYSINTVLNMRYKIQKKLEPLLGRQRAKKWALEIVMVVEEPLKIILY